MRSEALIIAVYAFILLVLFRLVLKRPAFSLILACNMFALEQWSQASSPLLGQYRTLTNIVAGTLVLLGVMIVVSKEGMKAIAVPKAGWFVLILYLLSLISIAWSPVPSVSWLHWHEAFPYWMTMVVLAPMTIRDRDDLRSAFAGILILGAVMAVLLLTTVPWEGRQIILGRGTTGEILGNPLTIGQLGGMILIFAVLYRSEGAGFWTRILQWIIAIIGLFLVIRSGSRGQAIGAVLVAGVFWAYANPSKSSLKPLIAMIVLGILIVGTKLAIDIYWAGNARFESSRVGGDYEGRFANAIVLLTHWMSSPWAIIFGLGSSASYDPRILGLYPHIVPLEVLGEEGVIGFLLLCLGIAASASGWITAARIAKDFQSKSLLASLAGMWVYSFLLICKQGSFLLAQDFFLYTILLAKAQDILMSNRQPASVSVAGERPANLIA